MAMCGDLMIYDARRIAYHDLILMEGAGRALNRMHALFNSAAAAASASECAKATKS